MNHFLYGAIVATCVAIAVRFFRFWRDTSDRLFLFFGLAFAIFGANWILLEVYQPPTEVRYYFYLVRLLAFVLIVVAVVDKNRRRAR